MLLDFFPTFLQLHREELQFLHPLLQLVLCGGGHRIHLLVTAVVVLVGVGVEHLERKALRVNGEILYRKIQIQEGLVKRR